MVGVVVPAGVEVFQAAVADEALSKALLDFGTGLLKAALAFLAGAGVGAFFAGSAIVLLPSAVCAVVAFSVAIGLEKLDQAYGLSEELKIAFRRSYGDNQPG